MVARVPLCFFYPNAKMRTFLAKSREGSPFSRFSLSVFHTKMDNSVVWGAGLDTLNLLTTLKKAEEGPKTSRNGRGRLYV